MKKNQSKNEQNQVKNQIKIKKKNNGWEILNYNFKSGTGAKSQKL